MNYQELSNIYKDLFDNICSIKFDSNPSELSNSYPTVEDGCHSLEIVKAMKKSVSLDGSWAIV